jgi:MOSC domain-containing protein YiiM
LKGKVIAVCRGAKKGCPKEEVGSGLFEKGMGLTGDAHAGTEKEVSILAKERVDALAAATGLSFPPGAFAENLLVEGLEEEACVPGVRLRVGEAVLEVHQIGKEPNIPHSYQTQGHSLLPRYGIFAKVLRGGIIRRGDKVEWLPPSSS